MSQSFEIISAALLCKEVRYKEVLFMFTFSKMSIYTHISRCTSQRFVFSIGNVFFRLCVNIFFRKAEV